MNKKIQEAIEVSRKQEFVSFHEIELMLDALIPTHERSLVIRSGAGGPCAIALYSLGAEIYRGEGGSVERLMLDMINSIAKRIVETKAKLAGMN